MSRGFRNMQGQQGWTLERKVEILIDAYVNEAEKHGYSQSDIPTMEMSTKIAVRNTLRDYAQKHWSRKWYTSYSVFAEALYATGGVTKHHVDRAYDAIRDLLNREGEKDGPFVITKNPEMRGGSRVPLTWDEYDERGNLMIEKKARAQFSSVKEEVAKRLLNNDLKEDEQYEDRDEDRNDQELEDPKDDEIGQIEEEPEPEDESDKLSKQAEEFWTKYAALREWTITRDVGGHQIDTLERRPYLAAAKMIAQGIPNQAIFHAMTMHWSPTNRAEQGIQEYDVRTFKSNKPRPDGMPPEYHYLRAMIDVRIWPWLISPAGVGKTTIVQKFAMEDYGKDWAEHFCAIPLNRGTSPSAFNGRPKVTNTSMMVRFLKAMSAQDEELMVKLAREAKDSGDVTISEFCKVLTRGGHALFDEIDAGDENLLMMANMPLANGLFANTATGETIQVSPDTIFWAASNTMGLGVTAGQGREYRGRNALDFATIDRFRMGRVKMIGDINDYRSHFEKLVLAYQDN